MTTPTIETEEAEAAFSINSTERAEWLLRKLANIEAEQKRIRHQADAMIAELETDRARLLHLYGLQLQQWAEAELQRRGGRRKTLRTLQGTLSFRHQAAGLRIYDTSAALIHARAACLPVLRVTKTLDTAAYRDLAAKQFEETGVTLPGVESYPEKENFSITFSKGE